MPAARCWTVPAKETSSSPIPGRARCAPSMAIMNVSCRHISPTFPGKYFTGDGCRRDSDGYYWITGRVDDVINVSGHRMGTAEVESALVAHKDVSEAAVVGFPHEIKGQGIYAYVTLMTGRSLPRSCAKNSSRGFARKSARLLPPTSSSSRQDCQRPAPEKSCAEFCARSRRMNLARLAIRRH